MSQGYDLNEVMDLVEEAQRKLGRWQGSAAYVPGARAVLEELALRAWQRAKNDKPEASGESPFDDDAERTPIHSPRGIVRENKVVELPGKPPRRRR